MPTEQCNFRCTYCYEDFEIGAMSAEVQNRLRSLLDARVPHLRHLNIQWFGGEPLAAKKIVFAISRYARNLCFSHGVRFTGALTTNGYLMDIETVRELALLNQTGYQVSLDGDEKGHNQTRRLKSGNGTFSRIWKNLQNIRDSSLEVSVLLRIHLTADNFESITRLSMMLRDELLFDHRFSVLLKPIENLGGPNQESVRPMAKELRSIKLKEIYAILKLTQLDSTERATANQICYASRPNSLVVRADGRVQKCTVALEDDRNTVGQLGDGGTVQLDRQLMSVWMRGYDTNEQSDLKCPFQNMPVRAKRVFPITIST